MKENKPQLLDVSRLPVNQAVEALVDRAVQTGASDLFFVTNEQHVAVQVRHLGIVRMLSVVSRTPNTQLTTPGSAPLPAFC